jgi:two-component system response regulator DctR
MGTIQVFVGDDDAIRDALGWLFRSRGLIARLWSSAEALIAGGEIGRCGCLLLDIRVAGMSRLELFEWLLENGHDIPVIFFTGHGDVPMAVAALKKGAFNFVEKPFNDTEVLDRALAASDIHHQRSSRQAAARELDERVVRRTGRELEVMERVLSGQMNKTIAMNPGVTMRAVEMHRARIFYKMDVRSAVELAQLLTIRIPKQDWGVIRKSGQYPQQPAVQIGDFIRAHLVVHVVGVPVVRHRQIVEHGACGQRSVDVDHAVSEPVRQKYRYIAIGGAALCCGLAGQRQIARQSGDAGQPLGMAQTGDQRHGATLREPHQHDAQGRNAARRFAGDQRLDDLLRRADARLVIDAEARREHVEPGAHDVAAVARDRSLGRIGQHETHRTHGVQIQRTAHRHEVVAVGTQAMQHDEGCARRRAGFEFDQIHRHAPAPERHFRGPGSR